MTASVQSVVDPLQRKDHISRGRFLSNILLTDVNVQTRMEAVQHYAKVLVLDHAVRTWRPYPRDKILQVGAELDSV
jgi:hypothetical protein